jgi:MHS family alpha-ketoglutarate permease-like MFS transporter
MRAVSSFSGVAMSIPITVAGQQAVPHDTRRRVMAIIAGSSGNLVEWYDFYVYSFCALYFAPALLPQGDQTAQLLSAAGVFAAGFLMRPIGGWFFGRYADRQGRRAAMVLSVLMMLRRFAGDRDPATHEHIGAAAAVLLVLARLLQGPVGRRRIWHQRHLYERSGSGETPRLLSPPSSMSR